MNISSQTQFKDLLKSDSEFYRELLNFESYELLDSAFCDANELLLYKCNNLCSIIQSDGLLNFKHWDTIFGNSYKENSIEIKNGSITKIINEPDTEHLISFNKLISYKTSPISIISILNELEALPNYLGYLEWTIEDTKIPFALLYESINNAESLDSWILKQLQDLSLKHDEHAFQLAKDTLEQLFEAIGVSLADLHNQVFKLSSFDDPSASFNSASYTTEDYQLFSNKLKNMQDTKKFPVEEILCSLNINLESNTSNGVKFRCHGNLDLSKILKTTKGLKVVDFAQSNPNLLEWNNEIDTPLNDIADLVISIKTLKESPEGRMIVNIDEIIDGFKQSLLRAYLNFIHFPFPEPYDQLLKAKVIERSFIKSFNSLIAEDQNNYEKYNSILKNLII